MIGRVANSERRCFLPFMQCHKVPQDPHPICTGKKEFQRESKLLCMQWLSSSILKGDIVGEEETAFYAWGEISFRFVLHSPSTSPPQNPRTPHSHVCRDLWPVTLVARGEGRVEWWWDKVMAVTAERRESSSHLLWQAPMYQSVQGFSLFKHATARKINKGVGWRSKVIVIHITPKHPPITDLPLKNQNQMTGALRLHQHFSQLSGHLWDMEKSTSDSQTNTLI